MNAQTHRREDAACIIVSIDRERAFWMRHYSDLPCRQAGLGFDACWPLLARAYDIYLHHPDAGRGLGAGMYARSPEVIGQALESTQAARIFDRVMDRIERATIRLQYPASRRAGGASARRPVAAARDR